MRTGEGLEYYDFLDWCSKVWSVVDTVYGADDPHPGDIRLIGVPRCSCSSSWEVQGMLLLEYQSRLREYIDEILESANTEE